MAKRIQGITIELDGETRGLDKALKDVNKRSIELQSELRDVDRLLKFSPDNIEAVAQKQKLLTEQVENTTKKLDQLKDAQKQVEDQFKKGEIGEQQYRAFRREIEFTETELNKFKQKLSEVDDGKALKNVKGDMKDVKKETDEAKQAVSELGGVIGGLAAGGGIAGAVSQALDTTSLNTSIEVSFDVSEESKQAVKEAILTIQSYGVDVEAALDGVRRQWALNKYATDEANAEVVKGAAAISKAYAGIDFVELIQETNEISKTLKISDDKALGLVNTLLKTGFPPEQLDIMSEYGTQLSIAGYNAQEIQAIFAAGVKTETWNIDSLLDGIKEGRILMAEFGLEVPKAMKDLLKGTDISSKQLQEWGKAVAKGGSGGSKAMQEVAAALNGIDDETKRNAIGIAIFGGLYEDQGNNIITTLLTAKDQVVDFDENQKNLNESVKQLDSDPAIQLQQAFTDMKIALEPLLLKIAEFITTIATWISQNPQLAATIAAVVTGLGILMGILLVLAPIFTAIGTISTATGIAMLPLVGIIAGVVAAIAGLVAIGIYMYKNWDTISKNFQTSIQDMTTIGKSYMDMFKKNIGIVWDFIKSTFSNALSFIKALVTRDVSGMKQVISDQMDLIGDTFTKIWNNVMKFLKGIKLKGVGGDIMKGLLDGIIGKAEALYKKASEIASNIKKKIKKALDINSPSRVMRDEVGRWIPAGIADGIEGNMGVIGKSVNKMSAAMKPDMPELSGNGLSATQSITHSPSITIQNMSVRDDTDIKKIARELRNLTKMSGRRVGTV